MRQLLLTCFSFFCLISFSQSEKDSLNLKTNQSVKISAEFPGGMGKFAQYITKQIIVGSTDSLIHTPYCRFVIDTTGKVKNVKIIRSSGSISIDNSIKKAIKEMPQWTPASTNGKPVTEEYNIPFRINLK
jgi:protein TonB